VPISSKWVISESKVVIYISPDSRSAFAGLWPVLVGVNEFQLRYDVARWWDLGHSFIGHIMYVPDKRWLASRAVYI
jgi:hypothetical protein